MAAEKVDFFIVGAPKCGTTSLTSYLKQHPSIFISRKKEPLYFCSDLEHSWRMNNLDDYLELFEDARPDQIKGEASVWYMFSHKAIENIREHNCNARIIVMLRDPVEATYSLHGQFLKSGNENVVDFLEAWNLQNERESGYRIPNTAHFPHGLQYKKVFLYSEQLKRILSTFPREQIHIVLFDELKENPERAHLEILKFLGVEEIPLPNYNRENESVSIPFPALTNFVGSPPIDVWKLPNLVPFPDLRERVSWRVNRLKSAAIRLTYRKERRPPMSNEARRVLGSAFENDKIILRKLLDKGIDNWISYPRN